MSNNNLMKTIVELLQKYSRYGLGNSLDYERFNHYGITLHSTAIEGSTLTFIDTQLLIEEGITPKGKPLEHSLMVKEFMSWQYKKHLEIEIAKFEDMNEDKPKGGGYSFVF